MLSKILYSKYFLPLLFLFLVSLATNIYFFKVLTARGLSYGDSWSRLNISRRVVDNLTPGLAQLGNVWPPLPQLFITPFASIDALYFSGLAPVFISSIAFVLGGIYLFAFINDLTRSKLASWAAIACYAFNPNIVHLQTTAMSEPLFFCAFFASLFYLWRWFLLRDTSNLIICGFFVMIATLTRYEGYFLLIAAAIFVAVCTYFRTRKLGKVESVIILFVMIGGLGIFLWCLYSWAIFGDPLNWAKIYTGKSPVISSVEIIASEVPTKSSVSLHFFFANFKSFLESSIEMSGIITGLCLLISIVIFPVGIIFKPRLLNFRAVMLIIFVSFSSAAFIIFSGIRNVRVIQNPPLSSHFLTDSSIYSQSEYNIRYGLMALPFIIIFITLAFSRIKFGAAVLSVLMILQAGLAYFSSLNFYYSVPKVLANIHTSSDHGVSEWMKQNYDDGLILISANANDPLMYHLNVPYSRFIFEGTDKYWKESIINPTKYAKWIVFHDAEMKSALGFSDLVSYYLRGSKSLDSYDEVYKSNGYLVYKLKN